VKIALAAGGSAGHVEPALTLADTMTSADPDLEVIALGTATGIESRLIPERGYRFRAVPAYPWPRRIDRAAFGAPIRIGRSVRTVTAVLREERPDVVVGFGGYVALPAYVAARRLGIPIVVHEANSRPGLADRVGARLTPWVAVNAVGVLPHSARIGMPLRTAIRELAALSVADRAAARDRAREQFGLEADTPTILAFGGSLGARRINSTMIAAAQRFQAAGIQVLHIVGEAGHGVPHEGVPAAGAGDARYLTVPYVTAMHEALAAADVVVCRAGAMTCAEIAAVGLPAIYIPLPVGNGEQALNARAVVDAGGGIMIDDADFDDSTIEDTVIPLAIDEQRRQAMGGIARTQAIVDADERLADMVRAAAAVGR
jgi:UDP-N-acetylglucosamine--N-acetylmuramyl-(pentapeptide) pyrophosphoryl-undecaprenol N-acetylglucosamine transferase